MKYACIDGQPHHNCVLFGYPKRLIFLSMKTGNVDISCFHLKKSLFNTLEVACRFGFSQASKNHSNQIFKSMPKLWRCGIASSFYNNFSFRGDKFDLKLSTCCKRLPFTDVAEVQKFCGDPDCCISLATQHRPRSLSISSYLNFACRR